VTTVLYCHCTYGKTACRHGHRSAAGVMLLRHWW